MFVPSASEFTLARLGAHSEFLKSLVISKAQVQQELLKFRRSLSEIEAECRHVGLFPAAQRSRFYRIFNAAIDVFSKDRARFRKILRERGLQQLQMLLGRFGASIIHRDHLITEVFVEYAGMRVHKCA
jgi:hypothetical protein